MTAELQRGNFGHGFLAADFSSAVGGGKYGGDQLSIKVLVGAIVGGTASAISGGKFANGAATSAFQVALGEGFASLITDKSPSLILSSYIFSAVVSLVDQCAILL